MALPICNIIKYKDLICWPIYQNNNISGFAYEHWHIIQVSAVLTLYSIIMPFFTPLKYNVFENIMENGAFAPLEQMLHFP